MTTRLKDSIRTKLIAEYIRTGKSPEGYEITENDASKYKVRKIKSQLEILQSKKDKLKKQIETIEEELKKIKVPKIEEVKEKLPEIQNENEEDKGDEIFQQ